MTTDVRRLVVEALRPLADTAAEYGISYQDYAPVRVELARLRAAANALAAIEALPAVPPDREALAQEIATEINREIMDRDGLYKLGKRCIAVLRSPSAGWQPIETAPRDGTIILLTDGHAVFESAWRWGYGQGHSAWRHRPPFADITLNCPTHWQPLPAPPAKEPTE